MPQPDAALLFAAGFGTRMRPLTDTLPKPLVKVAGRPLFEHALALVRDAGVGTVVANTHYHAALMAVHLAASNVVESHEATILDTGGGLKAALPLLSGDAVLTLNTDAVWTGPNPVAALLDAWDPNRMDGLMMLIPRESAVGHKGRGDFIPDASIGLFYSTAAILALHRLRQSGRQDDVPRVTVAADNFAGCRRVPRLPRARHRGQAARLWVR